MKKTALLLTTLLLTSCNQVVDTVLQDDMLDANAMLQDTQKEDLSDKEKMSLLQMREEEKLAHDVYIKMYELYEKQVFKNIASSEQTHTNAVKTLIEKYELTDPAKTNAGEFSSPDMQKLYTTLVEKGSKSIADALTVGATVEDLDIKDLQEQSKDIDNADILLVYSNLERGSRNHMRAFSKNLKAMGDSYIPQYITQKEYDAIIVSSQEKGGQGRGNGGGNGNGRGKN